MNPAVMQYLDASTAHLPEAERAMLASQPSSDGWPRVIKHDYGWWVNVSAPGDDDYDDIDAPALVAALRFAQRHTCNWINFDCDASEVDGLATYE